MKSSLSNNKRKSNDKKNHINRITKSISLHHSDDTLYKMNSTIIWARMSGFPIWPARYCTITEENAIKTLNKDKQGYSSVFFLGSKCAWIADTSIFSFIPETIDQHFVRKKFKYDKSYRSSVGRIINELLYHS